MTSPEMIFLYTDGACSGNPGPGGWGVVKIAGKTQEELYGGENNTTNNRMELMAAIEGIASTPVKSQITVVTDSRYVKDGMTLWLENWKRKGWQTSDKKPVKNKDLWQRLEPLCKERDVTWQWVKGHSGDEFNERADQLARNAIVHVLMQEEASEIPQMQLQGI